jgi:hypothetical protein
MSASVYVANVNLLNEYMNYILEISNVITTDFVVYWSEFLATDPEVRVDSRRYQIF